MSKKNKRIEYRPGICLDVFPGIRYAIEELFALLKDPNTDSKYEGGLMMSMASLSCHAIELFLKYKLQSEGISPDSNHHVDEHFQRLSPRTRDRIGSVFTKLKKKWNVNPTGILPKDLNYLKANDMCPQDFDPEKWGHIESLLTQIRSYNIRARYLVEKGQSFAVYPDTLLVAVVAIYNTLDDKHIED